MWQQRALTRFLAVVAMLVAGGTCGCATVIKGTTQGIPVGSEPTGARVAVDGKPAGITPTTVTLARKHSHLITLELPGYETENVTITTSVGGAVAGNIILGGLVGWGVDATSGAQYNLSPEAVNVRLRPVAQARAARAVVSSFVDDLNRLDEMRSKGTLSENEYAKLRAALVAQYDQPTGSAEDTDSP